ncbi:MAG: peptidylprolyl isomerase [Candidatus Schekmanbacteria bacterium]|nr:peptidylprolyl isomerase [Candidatus Schekmanbacteria bacterium]
MAQAKDGDKVKIHYTGKFDDGTVFDTSEGRDPLEFTLGEGGMIPGFEKAVIGMTPGDSKTERIVAEEAYGKYDEEMIFVVKREQFPKDFVPEVGKQIGLRRDDGKIMSVTIAELSDDEITIDVNHPLAGQDLNFDIRLVEII